MLLAYTGEAGSRRLLSRLRLQQGLLLFLQGQGCGFGAGLGFFRLRRVSRRLRLQPRKLVHQPLLLRQATQLGRQQLEPGGRITASSGHLIAPDQVSNLAAFKAYAYAYLLTHPRIHQGPNMFLLARTLEPSPQGVPLELYCYTNTTIWVEYEAIQGEIFDHLIAMLPRFGLSLYQRSSDYGMHYPAPNPTNQPL